MSSLPTRLLFLIPGYCTFLGKVTLDSANEQLREIVLCVWPRTNEELLDKIVPKAEGLLKLNIRRTMSDTVCFHFMYTLRD